MYITGNLIINASTIPAFGILTTNVNIKAITQNNTGSIVFQLNGPVNRTGTDSQSIVWRVFKTDTNSFDIRLVAMAND